MQIAYSNRGAEILLLFQDGSKRIFFDLRLFIEKAYREPLSQEKRKE
jgi:hypothetical protein